MLVWLSDHRLVTGLNCLCVYVNVFLWLFFRIMCFCVSVPVEEATSALIGWSVGD